MSQPNAIRSIGCQSARHDASGSWLKTSGTSRPPDISTLLVSARLPAFLGPSERDQPEVAVSLVRARRPLIANPINKNLMENVRTFLHLTSRRTEQLCSGLIREGTRVATVVLEFLYRSLRQYPLGHAGELAQSTLAKPAELSTRFLSERAP
jgi:hypothetical protein